MTRQSECVFNNRVDELASVSPVSSSVEGMSFVLVSTSWSSKFEWPEEVVGLFEMGTNCVNFIDKILNTGDVVFTQIFFNNFVIGKRKSLLVDFAVSSLVNEFTDRISGRISNIRKIEHTRK